MSADLIARLEKLTGPSREMDALIGNALLPRSPKWERNYGPAGAPTWTASIDAAVALVERCLPDTNDRKYSATVWTGARPAARIFYEQRDETDEGGWGIGSLNPWEVRGATPAIALLLALFRALEAEGARDE